MAQSPPSSGTWGAHFRPFSLDPDNGIRASSGVLPISERSEGSTSTTIPTVDQLRAAVNQLDVKMKWVLEMERQAQIRFEKMEADRASYWEEMKGLIWEMHNRPSPEYSGQTSVTPLPVGGPIEALLTPCSTTYSREEPLFSASPPQIQHPQTPAATNLSPRLLPIPPPSILFGQVLRPAHTQSLPPLSTARISPFKTPQPLPLLLRRQLDKVPRPRSRAPTTDPITDGQFTAGSNPNTKSRATAKTSQLQDSLNSIASNDDLPFTQVSAIRKASIKGQQSDDADEVDWIIYDNDCTTRLDENSRITRVPQSVHNCSLKHDDPQCLLSVRQNSRIKLDTISNFFCVAESRPPCARQSMPTKQKLQDALGCFREMLDPEVKLGAFSLNPKIHICGSQEQLSEVESLLQKRKKIGELLDSNYLGMSKTYMLGTQEMAEAKYEKWKQDHTLFNWNIFQQKTLHPVDRKHTRNLRCEMKAYTKAKEADHELYNYAIFIDKVVEAVGVTRRPRARNVLKMFLEHGFKPDVVTFYSQIDGPCRAHQIAKAFDCLNEMVEWNDSVGVEFVPSSEESCTMIVHASAHLSLIQNQNEILQADRLLVYARMGSKGVSSDMHTFLCLIKVCRDLPAMSQAHRLRIAELATKVFNQSPNRKVGCWTCLISVHVSRRLVDFYARCCLTECAREVFVKMPRKDVLTCRNPEGNSLGGTGAPTHILFSKSLHKLEYVFNFHRFKLSFKLHVRARVMFDGIEEYVDAPLQVMLNARLTCGYLDDVRKMFNDSPHGGVVWWNEVVAASGQERSTCPFQLVTLPIIFEGGIRPEVSSLNVLGSIFNLAISIIGVGIMALLATMNVLGIGLGFLWIILMGIISEISSELLVRFPVRSKLASYGEAVEFVLLHVVLGIILASHLGRPKGVTPKYGLEPLVPRLPELLGVLDAMISSNLKLENEESCCDSSVLLSIARFGTSMNQGAISIVDVSIPIVCIELFYWSNASLLVLYHNYEVVTVQPSREWGKLEGNPAPFMVLWREHSSLATQLLMIFTHHSETRLVQPRGLG